VQEEKSMTKQLSQNTRLVSGTIDEVAPIVKTEKIKYNPTVSAQQSPLSTKSVPVIATETRKVAYTETRVRHTTHSSLFITSLLFTHF
jgi:hypothetical protein